MRAGMILEALATDHPVHLLVLPVVAGAAGATPPAVRDWCQSVTVHAVTDRVDTLFSLIARVQDPGERFEAILRYPKPLLTRFATAPAIAQLAEAFPPASVGAVHVFRLYLAPFAEPWLAAGVPCRLDLDDHESRTRQRIADLHAAAGEADAAMLERVEGEKYLAMETQYLRRFERVYVCSAVDREEVARAHGLTNVAVIPNGVRPPRIAVPLPPDPFTFVFVGSLGYYPNDEAAVFFCSDVLPKLRARSNRAFRVLFVGSNPSARLRALAAAQPDVRLAGMVPDIVSAYTDAHAVIIPLRAGGGTRIKMLEAFEYRRPVVSTSLGAEGLEVEHGEHALLADTPDAFAAQCARLMEDAPLRDALATHALELVRREHTPEAVLAAIRRVHATS